MMNRNALVSLHSENEENEQLLITCEINEFQFEGTDGRTDGSGKVRACHDGFLRAAKMLPREIMSPRETIWYLASLARQFLPVEQSAS